MKKTTKKGFTLVELVIVIAIIAILAAVLIPTFSGVVEKANQSKALQTARNEFTEGYAEALADDGALVAYVAAVTDENNVTTPASGDENVKAYDDSLPDAIEGGKFVLTTENFKFVLGSDYKILAVQKTDTSKFSSYITYVNNQMKE